MNSLDLDAGFFPTWLLVGAAGLWAADCLVPGCLWSMTTPTPESADAAAICHAETEHPEEVNLP